MTVANGQLANQDTFNTSFVSREVDTSTIGVLALLNVLNSDSGVTLSNAQKEINDALVQIFTAASVTSGGTLSVNSHNMFQIKKVVGSPGAVTAANAPLGSLAGLRNGTFIFLVGTSDTNTVTITNQNLGGGALLNGNAKLEKNHVLLLMIDITQDRLIEFYRNF